MNSIIKTTFKAVQTGLQHFGVNIDVLGTSRTKFAGIRLQWSKETAGQTRGILVDAVIRNEPVCFFITNEFDAIQREHLHGNFYEQEELDIISEYFKGGIFVDIGANIGNHSLYALKFLNASKVIAFEPNPVALRILRQNINANGFSDRAVIHPVGLSDEEGCAQVITPENNLGGTRLAARSDASDANIPILRGDDVLADEDVDFLKIDTEGLELQVLNGLRKTLARRSVTIFVEIEEQNIREFKALVDEIGYTIVHEYRRYPTFTNFLIVPSNY